MKSIDISKLAGGGVSERFGIEMQKVLANIADPNTDPKKARKVTVTVTLKGDEKRGVASVSIDAKTTLAPARGLETTIVLGTDNAGNVVGEELMSGQQGQTFIDNDGDVADDTGHKIDSQGKRAEVGNVVNFK